MVVYSLHRVAGITKWLHRNGFSYRKPAGVQHKYSAEAQRAFLETYEKLKQETNDDEPILFIDGVHPTQGTKLAYGWMPAGKKVHNILDGAGYHRAGRGSGLGGSDKYRAALPAVNSPNFNLIERLWKVMNNMVRNNHYVATAKEFREKIRHFFSDTLPELAGNLSCRINDHFQKLKKHLQINRVYSQINRLYNINRVYP